MFNWLVLGGIMSYRVQWARSFSILALALNLNGQSFGLNPIKFSGSCCMHNNGSEILQRSSKFFQSLYGSLGHIHL